MSPIPFIVALMAEDPLAIWPRIGHRDNETQAAVDRLQGRMEE